MSNVTEQTVVRTAGAAAAMLRAVDDPSRAAVGGWNIGELAVHMLHVLDFELGRARREPIADVADFDALGRYTVSYVADAPVKDPHQLAGRIEAAAAEYAALTVGRDPEELYDWLGGTKLPLRTLHGHVVSELSVHTVDVARALGRSHTVPADAALAALEDFVVPLVNAVGASGSFGGPTAFVHAEAGRGFRACYEVRLTGGSGPRHFLINDGALHIHDPDPARRVDCKVAADPAVLLLVMWGRASQWPAVARFKLRAWGRKPWLAMKLASLIRTP
ncbi:MAG TPA: SCP2 sterol-binding domain-containing protein [Sporichthyaceae bacterium]|jgi:hypothetical protein